MYKLRKYGGNDVLNVKHVNPLNFLEKERQVKMACEVNVKHVKWLMPK